MTTHQPDTYPLGRSEQETRRLEAAANRLRVPILRFLEDAGIVPGMKVLDVGSAAGDVALLAAEVVGPSGAVVGIDMNRAILERARERAEMAGLGHVRFQAMQIPDGLGELDGDFDAIIGRRVLAYIPDPAAALRRLLEHARPGAVVAFSEVDWTVWSAHSSPRSPTVDKVWDWVFRGFEAGGMDMAMGTKLGPAMSNASLPSPEMRAEAGIGAATGAGLGPLLALVGSLREVIIRQGIATEADLDVEAIWRDVANESAGGQSVGWGGFEVLAWSRKP